MERISGLGEGVFFIIIIIIPPKPNQSFNLTLYLSIFTAESQHIKETLNLGQDY